MAGRVRAYPRVLDRKRSALIHRFNLLACARPACQSQVNFHAGNALEILFATAVRR
jgi:hypothetical protein